MTLYVRGRIAFKPLLWLAMAACLALPACTYPERTAAVMPQMLLAPAAKPTAMAPKERWRFEDPSPETLSVIVASGGGTRAAAFTLGILTTLQELCIRGTEENCEFTALDHVDMISSVSGSSLTSAFWAAKGREKFSNLRMHLEGSGFWDLFWRYLHPKSSIGGWFPARAQIDVLIDRFRNDDQFKGEAFGDLTFGDLPPRPQLILNATDMGAKNTFAFTPQNFYFLCSDLRRFRLAEAIAGSAAFPIAFGALSLRNQSYDGDERKTGDANVCPGFALPDWVSSTLSEGVARLVGDRSEFRRAERLRSYAQGGCAFESGVRRTADGTTYPVCKEWLHLLDGGIVDNLGITEPLWLLTNVHLDLDPANPYAPPYVDAAKDKGAFQTRQSDLTNSSYAARIFDGRINRVVILIANARGNPESQVETEADNPGWIAQTEAVTGGAIDAVSDLLVGKVAEAENLSRSLREEACEWLGKPRGCPLAGIRPDIAKNIEALKINIVPLDFDLIGLAQRSSRPGTEAQNKRDDVRKYFQSIPTTWWLDKEDIDLLQIVPACLLQDAADVTRIIEALTIANSQTSQIRRTAGKALSQCNYDMLYERIQKRQRD